MTSRSLPLCSVVFVLTSSVCVTAPVPPGTFQTACLQRHFWLSVNSGLLGHLGPLGRFDFEDQYGPHTLSDREAALCGYTVLVDGGGDLVLRASFQACHVHGESAGDLRLRLRFVHHRADGSVAAYALRLRCDLGGPRSTREIICEENYMEVSVRLPALPSATPNKKGADGAAVAVIFHRDDQPPEERRVVHRMDAAAPAAAGCHVSPRGPRLTLRCPYSSPHSYRVKEKGADVEVVRATVLYRLWRNVLAVDAAVACALNGATADGSDLVWTVPYVLSPLVHGRFRDGGARVGVNGRPTSDSESEERGFGLALRDGRLEVRVPFGVTGGHIRSGVVRGQYSRSMSVDLFLVRRWTDERWPLTQHLSLRLLRTPLIPQILLFTRNSVPPEGSFSVTLGVFAADASLRKVTVDGGGDLLTWTRSVTDVAVSRLSHPNGSHSYQLAFPLSHPKIIPESIGGGFETYSFTFSFIINILPSGEEIYHRATIEHSVAYTAPSSPKLEGKCTESSLLVLLRHGAQSERQWDVFLGGRRLDWDLVEAGGFAVEAEEDYTTVEIPSNSPGMNYLELTLQGLVSGVEVSVVDAESLTVEDRLVHRCTFPVRELLACLPEGRMVAVVDTTHTVPPTRPNRTALLDPSCVPEETDSSRALFSFGLDSCGTTATHEGNFLVYENEISSSQDFLPPGAPLIHRAPAYRLTIQCRYPANDTSFLSIHHPLNSSQDLSPVPVKRIRREAVQTQVKETGGGILKDGKNHHFVWITAMLVCLLLLLLAFCIFDL